MSKKHEPNTAVLNPLPLGRYMQKHNLLFITRRDDLIIVPDASVEMPLRLKMMRHMLHAEHVLPLSPGNILKQVRFKINRQLNHDL